MTDLKGADGVQLCPHCPKVPATPADADGLRTQIRDYGPDSVEAQVFAASVCWGHRHDR